MAYNQLKARAGHPSPRNFMILLLFVFLLLEGCATFRERYLLEIREERLGIWSDPHSFFIKLDLDGYAFFTKSKFEKGWYDKDAVDTLFSTLTSRVAEDTTSSARASSDTERPHDPPETPLQPLQTPPSPAQADFRLVPPIRRTIHVFGPTGEEVGAADKRLVIFVTNNPNGLLTQIETTAQTLATSEQFANLLRLPQVQEAQDAGLNLTMEGKHQEVVAIQVDRLAEWLSQLKTPNTVEGRTLRERLGLLIRTLEAPSAQK